MEQGDDAVGISVGHHWQRRHCGVAQSKCHNGKGEGKQATPHLGGLTLLPLLAACKRSWPSISFVFKVEVDGEIGALLVGRCSSWGVLRFGGCQ